jgi:hypothetical protein
LEAIEIYALTLSSPTPGATRPMWGQIIQDADFIHDLLRDLLGVVVQVVGDVLEDVAEADLGGFRPDYHCSISCLIDSLND